MSTTAVLAPAKKQLRVINPNRGTNRSGPTTQELIQVSKKQKEDPEFSLYNCMNRLGLAVWMQGKFGFGVSVLGPKTPEEFDRDGTLATVRLQDYGDELPGRLIREHFGDNMKVV